MTVWCLPPSKWQFLQISYGWRKSIEKGQKEQKKPKKSLPVDSNFDEKKSLFFLIEIGR